MISTINLLAFLSCLGGHTWHKAIFAFLIPAFLSLLLPAKNNSVKIINFILCLVFSYVGLLILVLIYLIQRKDNKGANTPKKIDSRFSKSN